MEWTGKLAAVAIEATTGWRLVARELAGEVCRRFSVRVYARADARSCFGISFFGSMNGFALTTAS
jgi:hypothetical protein